MNLQRISLALLILIGIAVQARGQSLQNVVESKRDCAICHLEWSPDFEKPGAILLIDKPTVSMASREATCLGCHDGSVRDSRKKVWQEQSHKTGVKPPASMKVPPGLPLEDGKLACRTCHTAHNIPGAEDLSNTFFLRVENDQSQLCQLCHSEKGDGPSHGSHPIGPMPVGVPDKLIAAGAKTGPKGQELICQSCHAAHGSQVDKLLVLSTADNELCSSCHEKLRPGQWGSAGHTHPINAPLSTDAQRQAIRDMGTHAGSGPGESLVCLSCHRLHDSPAKAKLLADTLTGSKLCLRCHGDRATVADTLHDLRKSAPTTQNSLRQTAGDSGPCSACHTPHQAARAPVVAKGDPNGECLACHAAGKVAAAKNAIHFNHPDEVKRADLPSGIALAVSTATNPDHAQLSCATCHNPHDASRTKFLREKPDQLCGTCHVDQAGSLAGSHDFTEHPTAKNGLGKSVDQTGKCGFCHNVHYGNGPAIWIATKNPPANAADMCVQCHSKSGLADEHPAPLFSHPTGVAAPATQPTAIPLPLFDAAGQRVESHGLVQCASCHNPHANSKKQPRMLRVSGNTSDLCLRCHSEKATLFGSIHDSKSNPNWPGENAGKDLCMGCHRAHGNDPARKLWAVTPATGVATADGVCIACHAKNRWADTADPTPANGAMMHPQIMPTSQPSTGSPNDVIPLVKDCSLPLVPAVGEESRTRIGCKTCHNPHAQREAKSLLRSPDLSQPEKVCFQCHKTEATLDHSMHAKNVLARNIPTTEPTNSKLLCAPCHAVHAVDGSQRDKLWAGAMDLSAMTPNEQRCLGCHDDQTAPRPLIPRHPSVVFGLLKWSQPQSANPSQYLPSDRSIPCGVCHLPHGNSKAGETLPVLATPEQQTALRGATKLMIRQGVAHDLCATCHGSDADRMFLYYHHPQQRQDVKLLQDPTQALEQDQ